MRNTGNKKSSCGCGKHMQDTELKRVKQYLFAHTATMKQVFVATGIIRENICRRIAELRKSDQICKIKISKCPITGNGNVGFYTTNQELFTKSPQLDLFGKGIDYAD